MYLDYQILQQYGACGEGLDWFQKKYPNGIEIENLLVDIQNGVIQDFDPHILHWGKKMLPITPKELIYYEQIFNIINSEYVTNSEKINNSSKISFSKNVNSSSNIYFSRNIDNSQNISTSFSITNSIDIYHSKNIYSSRLIVNSFNCFESNNLYKCQNCLHVNNGYQSDIVSNSSEIYKSKHIQSSHLLNQCINVKSSMFCYNLKDSEYCIFNKEIDEELFKLLAQNYLILANNFQANYYKKNPEMLMNQGEYILSGSIDNFYSQLSEEFWGWVRTLPNYDEDLLYKITLNKNLIK